MHMLYVYQYIYIYNMHTGWIWKPNNSEVVTPNHLGRGQKVSFEEGKPNESDAKNLMIRENRKPRGIGCMFCKIPLTCSIWVENDVISK